MRSAWLMAMVCLTASAEEPSVPVEFEVELLSKVAKYDRHFRARVGDAAVVLVVYDTQAPESEMMARRTMAALESRSQFASVPFQAVLKTYRGAAELRVDAERSRACAVILGAGLERDAKVIGQAFTGYDGLTVSATSTGVNEGLVLGFDLVSGKPVMLINLEQAHRQHIDFSPEVLRLMKVFQ